MLLLFTVSAAWGKTELALAYAHAFAWDYPGGRWLARCEGLDNPMLKPDSEPAADTPWQQLVDSLLSLRLLQPGGDVQVVRMHRLVQELMRKGAADAVPIFETALLAHVKSRAEFLWEGWVQHEHRWELGPLVACAWLWMERGVQEGAYLANLANGPLLAQLLKATNRLQEAEPLMRRALEIDEQSFGPDHPNVAIRLGNLAQLLYATNRLAEAEPLMRRALAITEQSLGSAHPNVARDLNNLASLLQATNRLAEAEQLIRRALAIDEQSFGTDHPNVAICLNNLAGLLYATNRLAEAEPLVRRHLEIFLRFTVVTGHQHPHLRPAIRNYTALVVPSHLASHNRAATASRLARA